VHTNSWSSACCSCVFSFTAYTNSGLSCLPPCTATHAPPAPAFPTSFGFLKSHEQSSDLSADPYQLVKGQPETQQPPLRETRAPGAARCCLRSHSILFPAALLQQRSQNRSHRGFVTTSHQSEAPSSTASTTQKEAVPAVQSPRAVVLVQTSALPPRYSK